LHWMGRLILLVLNKHSAAGLTYSDIKKAVWGELHQQKTHPPQDFLEGEFTEQMAELEYIFDAIKLEGQAYKFSIPLAKQWFDQTVRLNPNASQQACAGIMRDCEKWLESSKEQSA